MVGYLGVWGRAVGRARKGEKGVWWDEQLDYCTFEIKEKEDMAKNIALRAKHHLLVIYEQMSH
jgi:hypothetical protein